MNLRDVKVGDVVVRVMGVGGPEMRLRVFAIENGCVLCRPPTMPNFPDHWTFDVATGAEIDHDLRWGPQYGQTGTWIKSIIP